MDRLDFLKGVAITGAVAGVAPRATAVSDIDSRVLKVSAFNYDGNRLTDSRWKDQYQERSIPVHRLNERKVLDRGDERLKVDDANRHQDHDCKADYLGTSEVKTKANDG